MVMPDSASAKLMQMQQECIWSKVTESETNGHTL
jgi:hypothetical protein